MDPMQQLMDPAEHTLPVPSTATVAAPAGPLSDGKKAALDGMAGLSLNPLQLEEVGPEGDIDKQRERWEAIEEQKQMWDANDEQQKLRKQDEKRQKQEQRRHKQEQMRRKQEENMKIKLEVAQKKENNKRKRLELSLRRKELQDKKDKSVTKINDRRKKSKRAQMESHDGVADDLPQPPSLPPSVELLQAEETDKLSHESGLITRPGFGMIGNKIQLVTNHLMVSLKTPDEFIYHYHVNLKYEDGRKVDNSHVGSKVIEKLQQNFAPELAHRELAYDGDRNLYTIGELTEFDKEFVVIIEGVAIEKNIANGAKMPCRSETFKVELRFAAKIPMSAIALALKGHESEHAQQALQVFDIILRQHNSRRGCFLVSQSFFRDDLENVSYLGEGVIGCRGFHSTFRATQNGISLNFDVSTTVLLRPDDIMGFVMAHQKIYDPNRIDWVKAKDALKNLRIATKITNKEYRIVGLSDKSCSEQMFSWQNWNGGKGDTETIEISVSAYFQKKHGIELMYSGDHPCINVGKPKRPIYFPIEVCTLVSPQRYTKALNTVQTASLIESSRQEPHERMTVLYDELKRSSYDTNPMLSACGISIAQHFTLVAGRVLHPPRLKAANDKDILTNNGRWNFNNMDPYKTAPLKDWVLVNFSTPYKCTLLVSSLIKCAIMKGFDVDNPLAMFEENGQVKDSPAPIRVNDMFKQIKRLLLKQRPKLVLCVLSERTSTIYGPWKRACLVDNGIVTQCVAPTTTEVNDQYLTNVLLKINAKLGGMNSLLQIERSSAISLPLSDVPTMILGMDVSHGPPGQSGVPSIAAVVSSRNWPSISNYRAFVRSQKRNQEMIDSLCIKPDLAQLTGDGGIIRECLLDFYQSSKQKKPDHIIIFRDGVSESQFKQVLDIELQQIIEACKLLDADWDPKFTVIVAQKNHHTRFFIPGSHKNVPPGTVVDNAVCHPRNYDFYMCSHAGVVGTTRPTHYHILHDEIKFTPDDLQDLVHSLCYVYQRSTTAISVVAPIRYAHLAAAQVAQFLRFGDTSSEGDGDTFACTAPVKELPHLHEDVKNTMFFC